MSSILDTIAEATRQRIAQRRAELPDEAVVERAYAALALQRQASGHDAGPAAPTPAFEQAIAAKGMSFICEVKKASPSKGIIAEDFPYLAIAQSYEQAGAAAISCLTEPQWFLGADEYLERIAQHVSIPVLRKDFVVCERMVYEAKALGAEAVLLICSILDDAQLDACLGIAHDLGMSALVEAHDEREIKRAKAAGARIVGVNNRDLKTFSVNTDTSVRLRECAGADVLFVAESGIATRRDVAQLEACGVDAVLVGEALMRSADKRAALDELRGRAL